LQCAPRELCTSPGRLPRALKPGERETTALIVGKRFDRLLQVHKKLVEIAFDLLKQLVWFGC